MLHIKLMELEAEKIARDQATKSSQLVSLPHECELLKAHIEEEIGIKLGAICDRDFNGWLTYRRQSGDLIIIRGRAFKESNMLGLGKWRAGLDVGHGLDSVSEALRGFDVSPPPDLDHLTVNFGVETTPKVFLWYGENISAYRLIFAEELENNAEKALDEALSEAMSWVLNKPKDLTLPEYIKKLKQAK